jgi:hypothetical protein
MTNEKREGIGGRGKKRGLERAVVALTPEELEVVRDEAIHRMKERKVGRVDAGEVVREAVDTWVRVKDDPVQMAMERMQKAMAAGDLDAAKEAGEEVRRLAEHRAKEVMAQTKANLDEFVKRVRGRK